MAALSSVKGLKLNGVVKGLSLKQGTGNRRMGMGNGERGTGNEKSLKRGIFKSGESLKAGILKRGIFKSGNLKTGNL